MQRRLSSPKPFLGALRERECPRCQRPVELPLGVLCRDCRQEIERRARRLARWVSGVTTLLLMGYVLFRLPPAPRGRMVIAMAVAVWYLLVNLVVRRAARELLP